jgi:transposase
MKKYASATLRKGKTDKMDSVRIANWFQLIDYSAPEAIYGELRMLGRQYAHYISMRIKSKQVLTDLLDRTMPGIKSLLSSKRSEEPTKGQTE